MEITVVQPDGLIPIIHGRGGREAVAGSLGRILVICLVVKRQFQWLSWIVIEIVLRSPMDSRIVIGTQRLDLRMYQTDFAVIP